MTGLVRVLLLVTFVIEVGGAAAGATCLHIEGVWMGQPVSSPHIDTINVSPFEVFLGETNYYFVLHGLKPTNSTVEPRDYVATCDGRDYFWTCYRFPLEDGNKSIKWANSKEAMGSGEVGIGSFPSNAPPSLQTLWMALAWHPQTNNQHPFGGDFALSRMVGENRVNQAKEFSVAFSSKETNAVSAIRVYSPGTKDDINYPDGWLYSALFVLQSTNFAGSEIPLQFVYYDYATRRNPGTESSQQTAKPDAVRPYWAYAFVVTNLTLVTNQPSAFPPEFAGKPVLIRDHRPKNQGDIVYMIGAEQQFRGAFVSRSDPEYHKLLTRFSKITTPEITPRKRVFLICTLIVVALFPIFFGLKQYQKS